METLQKGKSYLVSLLLLCSVTRTSSYLLLLSPISPTLNKLTHFTHPQLTKMQIGSAEKTQAQQLEDEICAMCPKLTYSQRLTGFISCWAGGYLISFCSTLSLLNRSPQGLRNFSALYVIGNLTAICATGFLIGPRRQCNKMFHKTRRVACVMYLSLLLTVLVLAVTEQPVGLVILFWCAQFVAATWYAASYIPYGRKMLVGFFKNCCGRGE